MLMHACRSVNGPALPSWLKLSPIFVTKHVRNKDESLVEEAELMECNPTYAHVRLSSGRETTVSVRDIAPRVESNTGVPENSGETFPHYVIKIVGKLFSLILTCQLIMLVIVMLQ